MVTLGFIGLIVSGLNEEEKNFDAKIKKARGSLYSFLGPIYSSKSLLSPRLQLHIYRTYICPIARSGLAAMSLREKHLTPLMIFQRKILRAFLHLSEKSPNPALYFLTGELPINAMVHKDVFSLFHNVWSNPNTKVFEIVKYLLHNAPLNSNTWSSHVKSLAFEYEIEDPTSMITKKPSNKAVFKEYINSKITSSCEKQLRDASRNNSKMSYFNVSVKGLNGRCHSALIGCKETKDIPKLRAHIKLLCGDLFTYEQRSKYIGGSPHCRLCSHDNLKPERPVENVCHLDAECEAFKDVRENVVMEMKSVCSKSDYNLELVFNSKSLLTQFILDCTSLNLPNRISPEDPISQDIFKLSRDICFHICSQRSKMLETAVS